MAGGNDFCQTKESEPYFLVVVVKGPTIVKMETKSVDIAAVTVYTHCLGLVQSPRSLGK